MVQLEQRLQGLFLSPSSAAFVGWSFVSLLLAGFVYWRESNSKKNLIGFLRFCFPREVYASASFREDLLIILTYISLTFVFEGVRASLTAFFSAQLGEVFFNWQHSLQKIIPTFAEPAPFFIFVIVYALAIDFGNFLSHYLMHRFDFLWQFHKVHHSTIHLAPTAQFRSHPIEGFLKAFLSSWFGGLSIGALLLLGAITPEMISFSSIWLVSMTFYLTVHLRHSHIWFSFGPVLSYVFSSPAMHQIHHSIEKRHLGKNLAITFSLWDWLFGTLYIPKEKESFRIGLLDEADQRQFRGLFNLLFLPFVLSAQGLVRSLRGVFRGEP